MSRLELYGRSSGSAHALPGEIVISAEEVWDVVGPAEALDALCATLPAKVRQRWRGGVLLQFVNCVGVFDLGPLGRLHVRSGKWSQDAFDAMLRDLSGRAAALPFAWNTGSSLPYDRTLATDQDVLWHAFVYLRHVLSDAAVPGERLPDALRAILADPHRALTDEEDEVPTALASHVTNDVLLDLAAGAMPLARVQRGRYGIADRLGGHMPLVVRTRRVEPMVDTAPNRFVKAFLDQCLAVCDRVADLAGTGALRAEAVALRAALQPLRRADLWNDVGPMVHFPSASTVLQRRRGYREVFHIAQRLRMSSRVPLDPRDVVGLLENKDIATLYELWTWFAVVDAVAAVLGPPPRAWSWQRDEYAVGFRRGYAAAWPGGYEALYNPTFSLGGTLPSRSVELRPDVLVRTPRGSHVFDAKFKLDGTQDITKMHAYRDALDEVVSAWVVYPGAERFEYEMPEGWVGALPASPGATEPLFELMKRILGASSPREPLGDRLDA